MQRAHKDERHEQVLQHPRFSVQDIIASDYALTFLLALVAAALLHARRGKAPPAPLLSPYFIADAAAKVTSFPCCGRAVQ